MSTPKQLKHKTQKGAGGIALPLFHLLTSVSGLGVKSSEVQAETFTSLSYVIFKSLLWFPKAEVPSSVPSSGSQKGEEETHKSPVGERGQEGITLRLKKVEGAQASEEGKGDKGGKGRSPSDMRGRVKEGDEESEGPEAERERKREEWRPER